jgi:DNA-binding transcriptional regulator GbsR (MarR family)
MDVAGHDDGPTKRYTTSHRVQAWFLGRSRDRWKRKYQDLKAQAKRLQNRVHDVSKSRAQWREEAEKLQRQLQELEVHNAALLQQVASKKKGGVAGAARSS